MHKVHSRPFASAMGTVVTPASARHGQDHHSHQNTKTRVMHTRRFADLARTLALGGLCATMLWASAPVTASERTLAQACRSDARKFCTSLRPGEGRIVTCLRENTRQLSAACQFQLNKIDTCAVEIQQLCADITDEGEKQQCHKDRRTELSAGCQAAAGD
jgi:hypothetical protein